MNNVKENITLEEFMEDCIKLEEKHIIGDLGLIQKEAIISITSPDNVILTYKIDNVLERKDGMITINIRAITSSDSKVELKQTQSANNKTVDDSLKKINSFYYLIINSYVNYKLVGLDSKIEAEIKTKDAKERLDLFAEIITNLQETEKLKSKVLTDLSNLTFLSKLLKINTPQLSIETENYINENKLKQLGVKYNDLFILNLIPNYINQNLTVNEELALGNKEILDAVDSTINQLVDKIDKFFSPVGEKTRKMNDDIVSLVNSLPKVEVSRFTPTDVTYTENLLAEINERFNNNKNELAKTKLNIESLKFLNDEELFNTTFPGHSHFDKQRRAAFLYGVQEGLIKIVC
jgi:hypothetical protein